jgi:dolichol-phosphate mannosyltransferase
MTGPKVSVILPTYNERESICELIVEVLEVLRGADLTGEVLVVDDASPDGTGDLVHATFGENPSVRVEVRRGERGLATAILRGCGLARGETVLVMDSDGNHDPRMIPVMVMLAAYYDVVCGSRYVAGGGMAMSRLRFIGSYLFNLVVKGVLGVWTNDNLSGFLCFRRSLLRELPTDRIFYGYGDYGIRLLYWVHLHRRSIIEVPVVYHFRKGGESKTNLFRYFWTYLLAVFRLRFFGL